jgi:hypothetical protein
VVSNNNINRCIHVVCLANAMRRRLSSQSLRLIYSSSCSKAVRKLVDRYEQPAVLVLGRRDLDYCEHSVFLPPYAGAPPLHANVVVLLLTQIPGSARFDRFPCWPLEPIRSLSTIKVVLCSLQNIRQNECFLPLSF